MRPPRYGSSACERTCTRAKATSSTASAAGSKRKPRSAAEDPDDLTAMRREAIALDPHLQAREREQMTTALDAIATAAATTLGQQPTDFGPRAFAAATISVLQTIQDSQDRDATPNALDRTFTFLRAGLDALRLE